MAQTSQETVQNLVDRAVKLGDRQLAADIRAFAAQRQFGLVFEHNRPERMRLHGKKITRGDIVQVLPARGEREKPYNKLLWRVESISGDTAGLVAHKTVSYYENDESPRQALVCDIVAVAEYDQPIYAGLKETGRVDRGGDRPYQVVINGENYHALETLAFAYAGKVDCIYIDPPYNTGARDWKYNNDYVDGSDEYRHSKWLAFMERRLKLAKQLLNPEESVLIVTIDEKEYLRLGLLLKSIFPDANIPMITSVISRKGSNRRNEFSRCGEFIYYVMLGDASPISYTSDMNGTGKAAESESPVCWQYLKRRGTSFGASRRGRPGLFYPIYINSSDGSLHSIGKPLPAEMDRHLVSCPEGTWAAYPLRPNGEEGCWQIQPSRLQEQLNEGTCYLSRVDKSKEAAQFLYLKDADRKKVLSGQVKLLGKEENGKPIIERGSNPNDVRPKDIWIMESHDATHGSNMINSMLVNRRFPFPKSLYAVEDTIRFFVGNKPNALVVDFFSGSGTTAHAVMRLNRQDGGRRRCVCITNNEVSDEEGKKLVKQGFRQGDSEWEALGICQYVTKPRVTAAITGKTPEGDPIKGDYKFTDKFPMADGFEENAIFFDLTYEDPDAVELGVAFEQVAPLLWLRAGAKGRIIEHESLDYEIADSYAVLFDYASVGDFIDEVSSVEGIACAYVITDDTARYANVKAQLPGIDVVRLYENYLQSFKIAAEDAVR